MPQMPMKHDKDPKDVILEAIGDLSGIELFHNQALVVTYMRPKETASGLILTDHYREEDKWQSKVGLLVKKGPDAFQPNADWFAQHKVDLNDWLVFRPQNGWNVVVNGQICRIIDDVDIKGRITDPDLIY